MSLPPTFSESSPALVNVIVETPRGTRSKYVYEPSSGLYRLKRVTPPGTCFPLDFGFIPGTKGEDGDPLDALMFMEEPGWPGCVVECRIIGVLTVRQKKQGTWIRNDRFLTVAGVSSQYSGLRDISGLDEGFLDQIDRFFVAYHVAEGGEYVPLERLGKEAALSMIK